MPLIGTVGRWPALLRFSHPSPKSRCLTSANEKIDTDQKYWDLVLSNLPTESSPLYPYTTNATHLNKGLVKILLQPDSKDKLTAILTYHVLPARVTAEEIPQLSSARTLNGEPLQIKVNQGQMQVNQSSVISADILCSNGVIHVIDSVLIPE